MSPDLIDLRNRYSKLDTEELLRLSEGGEFVAEVQNLIDEELARRSDRHVIIAARTIRDFAASEIAQGLEEGELQERLVKEGMAPAEAATVIKDAAALVGDAKRRGINARILAGVALFIVGIIVTGITYAGSANTGGYYLVAGGAIISDLIQFVGGLRALLGGLLSNGRRRRAKKPVYYVLGKTSAGRHLFCVVIQFPGGKGFPVTATTDDRT